MSCPAVNDPQRSSHWRTTNWNCAGSASPEYCNANEVQIAVNKSPGGWGNGCVSFDDRTQYVCSPPYDTSTNTLWGCCSGATSSYQCDPSYCVNSSGCSNFLASNCTGQILFSNDGSNQFKACNTWCAANPVACNAIKKEYCNNASNLALPVCQSFAQSTANSGDNTFDSTVQTYCASHPTDPFCGCQLKAPKYTGTDNNLLKLLNAPECYDATCINSGYENTNQISFRKNGNCPTSICSNTIDVNNVSSSNISNIIASCSSTSNSSNSSISNSSTSNSSNQSYSLIYFLLFLFVIIISFLFWPTKSIIGGHVYKNEFIV